MKDQLIIDDVKQLLTKYQDNNDDFEEVVNEEILHEFLRSLERTEELLQDKKRSGKTVSWLREEKKIKDKLEEETRNLQNEYQTTVEVKEKKIKWLRKVRDELANKLDQLESKADKEIAGLVSKYKRSEQKIKHYSVRISTAEKELEDLVSKQKLSEQKVKDYSVRISLAEKELKKAEVYIAFISNYLNQFSLMNLNNLKLVQVKSAFNGLSYKLPKELKEIYVHLQNNNDLFSASYYLTEYPDVKNENICPLFHFLTAGVFERRSITANPNSLANFISYIKRTK